MLSKIALYLILFPVINIFQKYEDSRVLRKIQFPSRMVCFHIIHPNAFHEHVSAKKECEEKGGFPSKHFPAVHKNKIRTFKFSLLKTYYSLKFE